MTHAIPEGVLATSVAEAFGPEGPIAREHRGYVARAGQLELAREVATAIEGASSLVAEAGTGIGKTFAYLVPALLSGARILISTGTRNLQDQLFGRDLPELSRLLGTRVDVALLKGRANYVCWHHLQRNLEQGRFARREDIAQLHRIQRFAVASETGDRSGFPGVPEESPVWAMATSTRENCLGQDCPELARCFLFKARQAAQRADLVVVNHHLFCADLALRDEGVGDLLPTADALIFDEAHQLPEIATQFFGASVSSRRLLDFARDTLRVGHADARDAADWTALSQGIEQAVRELRLEAGPPARLDAGGLAGRASLLGAIEACERRVAECAAALDSAAERSRDLERCAGRATELVAQISAWRSAASRRSDPGEGLGTGSEEARVVRPDDAVSRQEAAAQSADAVSKEAAVADPDAAISEEAAAAQPADPVVVWAEVHASGVTLHATPLSIATVFRRHVQARPRGWVFLSATLSVGGDFGHFVATMGLEDARRRAWESPFDFATQGLLYVPEGLGEPSGPGFAERMFEACWPLVEANRGRAFLLCTTLRMVDRLASLAADAIAGSSTGLELLVQGSASRAELIDRFRRETAPVLIGSASFWEGVDVPGDQLSLVVIDKLPFAPPDDPVLRARTELLRRAGDDPFRAMQLPMAAMALKQGAGRLIRSERDRGLLVVCDVRLAERRYGRWLLRSLPPFRRTRSLDEALRFLETGRATSRTPTSADASPEAPR